MATETESGWLYFPGFVDKNQAEERESAVRRATQPLSAGVVATCVAVVVCVVGGQMLGGTLLLTGSALLLWGLHRLGRLGADPPGS
jgi:hypothetical protein